jgi:hypothetical protein
MLEFDIPKTIRQKFNADLETHDTYCFEGYITHINEFSREVTETKCPYCEKFHKELFDND